MIHLHYEKGYGEDRIALLLPMGYTTVLRWIFIFASQNSDVPHSKEKAESMEKKREEAQSSPDDKLCKHKSFYAKLQMELRREHMHTDLLDEMINVGEAMFKVPIRKKVHPPSL